MRSSLLYVAAGSVLLTTANAEAAVTAYTNRAVFLAAMTPTQNIDFEGISPAGGYTLVNGQSIGGVTFTNTTTILGAVDPGYYPSFYDWSSGATLLGYYYGDPTVGALPSYTRAVGADVMVVEFQQGGIPYTLTAEITLADSSTQSLTITTQALPNRSFLGFTSDVPIVSIAFYTPDDSAIGLFPLPILDNFVYQATNCLADTDADGVCDNVDNCLTVANPSQADTDADGSGDACDPACVTIQRGTSGSVADTFIVNTAGDASKNFGGVSPLVTSSLREALIRWDLGLIPANAIVSSATATVYLSNNTGSASVQAHRITAPWVESTVTWNSFGQAFAAPVESAFLNGGNAYNGTVSFDLTPLTQAWLSGASSNNGVLLEQTPATFSRYQSSESPTVARRPKLTVCYVIPG